MIFLGMIFLGDVKIEKHWIHYNKGYRLYVQFETYIHGKISVLYQRWSDKFGMLISNRFRVIEFFIFKRR